MKIVLTIILVALVITVQSATLNVRRIVNANAPPSPTNFVVLLNGANTTNVFLTWGNAATNYATIQIERTTNSPVWVNITNIFGTNAAFTDSYTWTNAATYYRIKAVGSNGLDSLWNNQQ